MAESLANSPVRPYNVSEVKSPIGFYKALFRLHDASIKHCIPAIVKKYDRKTGIVTVQPIVQAVIETSSGEDVKDRPEYTVPVRRICHGGLSVEVPLFVGDTGWLISGDRSSDVAREKNSERLLKDDDGKTSKNEGPQRPDSQLINDFSCGFFLPDYWGKTTGTSNDGIVVEYAADGDNESKNIKILIGKDGVEVSRGGEGGDKITLNDDGIKYDGKEDRAIEVVTALRYDINTHQIQKKTVEQKIRGDFVVGVGEESDWTMIDGGQAVPEQQS